MPERIQRRRVAGWRMPEGAVYLACWCELGMPCHADYLLEIANGGDRG